MHRYARSSSSSICKVLSSLPVDLRRLRQTRRICTPAHRHRRAPCAAQSFLCVLRRRADGFCCAVSQRPRMRLAHRSSTSNARCAATRPLRRPRRGSSRRRRVALRRRSRELSRLGSGHPVTGTTPVMAHGEHLDYIAHHAEDDRKGERGHWSPADCRCVMLREPTRRFFDAPQGAADCSEISRSEADLPRLIPGDLVQVLGFSTGVVPNAHFRSARAFASTSSAGTSLTSPRSI